MKNARWILATVFATLVLTAGCGTPAQPTLPATPTQVVVVASTNVPVSPTPTRVTPSMPTTAPASATATQSMSTSPTAPPMATRTSISARLNEPFTLGLGQEATLLNASDTRVRFTTLLEDTRCPIDANCVRPGRVLVLIETESDGKLARLELGDNALAAFNGYLVEFVDLTPYPRLSDPKIPLSEYQVTLRVRPGLLPVSQARFNQPFTLKHGQSVGFEGSSMRLTFETVKQDSRCPARALCASRGTTTLTVLAWHDNTSERYTLEVGASGVMTTFPAVRTVAVTIYAIAITPYPQREFASKEIAPSEYEAIFLVVNPAMPYVTPTPSAGVLPQPVTLRDLPFSTLTPSN